MRTFALRTGKDIVRDPLAIAFGLGFPLILLLLMTAIQANLPVDLFRLEQLTPGISVFGQSFLTLFSASLIARDRGGALLQRLYTTPLTAADFILGYTLPLLPMALSQSALCYLGALALGMRFSAGVLWAVLGSLPVSLVFIGLGLLCGAMLNDRQVGGLCGALLTNLTAWLSGVWFDPNLLGSWFGTVANALPFAHAVKLGRAALGGSLAQALPHLWWVLGYGAAILAAAVLMFLRQLRKGG